MLRTDGIGMIDAFEMISTSGSQHISVHAQGYITPPEGLHLPPPDVLLSLDFHCPDVPLPIHGFWMLRSGAGSRRAWVCGRLRQA